MLKMTVEQKQKYSGNFCILFLRKKLQFFSGSVFEKIMLSFFHVHFTYF